MKNKQQKRGNGLVPGIFLIGIGILMFFPISIFPWILLVAGVAFVPNLFIPDRARGAFVSILWLVGLFLIFFYLSGKAVGAGVLILTGLHLLIPNWFKEKKSDEKTEINA